MRRLSERISAVKTALPALATAVLLSAAVACGGQQGEGEVTEEAGSPGAASPASSPAADAGTAQATVAQADFSFSPEKLKVKRGATIAVTNRSPRTPHTFTVQGEGIDVANGGHETKSVTIDLAPATYEFVCTFHEARGMTGTLTVT